MATEKRWAWTSAVLATVVLFETYGIYGAWSAKHHPHGCERTVGPLCYDTNLDALGDLYQGAKAHLSGTGSKLDEENASSGPAQETPTLRKLRDAARAFRENATRAVRGENQNS